MQSILATILLASFAVDDDTGFGGAPAAALDAPAGTGTGAAVDVEVPASAAEPAAEPAAATAALPTWNPPAGEERADPAAPTPLELELQKAGIDPQRYPLVRLRVDFARLSAELEKAERRGLSAARVVEQRWEEARALLDDAEQVALFRLHRCAVRLGHPREVRRFRMTAGGAVPLSTDQLIAQANALDPPGCARIDLVDDALIEKLRRARTLKATLSTQTFAFHELDRRRALEDELAALKKSLAAEGAPALRVAGERGYSR